VLGLAHTYDHQTSESRWQNGLHLLSASVC
jgi:hypothetical protein